MEYFIVAVLLLILMLAYFQIAEKYNIIDKPNHRSAHTEITLRGGGVIFPIAYLFFMVHEIFFKQNGSLNHAEPKYWIFGAGLLIICTISFIDDLMDLSRKLRIIFHFISVTFLLVFLNAFSVLPVWSIPIFYILIIGILNAYNFMDGINGIAGLYSLVILLSLLYVNQYLTDFVHPDFIIFPVLGCVVFLFFNFRKRAKCFMGDIGSMGIAFWVISLIGLLIIKTGEAKWILFLTVYGVEVIFTILERLQLKENIFEAHRRHLYQLLANEKKVSHLVVSFFYAITQVVLNVLIIYIDLPDYLYFPAIIIPSVIFYLYTKFLIKKQILFKHQINENSTNPT